MYLRALFYVFLSLIGQGGAHLRGGEYLDPLPLADGADGLGQAGAAQLVLDAEDQLAWRLATSYPTEAPSGGTQTSKSRM